MTEGQLDFRANQKIFLPDFYKKLCYHSIGRAAEGIWSLSMHKVKVVEED